MVFLRSMSGGEHAITITFYFSLTFMVCAGLTAVQGWPMPTPTQWLLIVLAGLFGVFGQLLMTYSYRSFFAEIPSLSIWLGAPLILASGLIILWREYSLKKQLSVASSQS
jgi:drug/metabolite transporter (DMT)-like permease